MTRRFFGRLADHLRQSLGAPGAAARLYFSAYWAYAGSFCLLGACLAFAQPLLSVPDELTHWQQSHLQMEKAIHAKKCIETVTVMAMAQPHAPPPVPIVSFAPLQCGVSPDAYSDAFTYPGVVASKLILPNQTESVVRQVQAIALARLLQGLMVLGCLLRLGALARAANRPGVLLVAAFTLSPLFAQQSFGVSADGSQLAHALMLSACILFLERMTGWDLLLFILTGWGASAKPFLLPCFVPSLFIGHWLSELRRDPGVSLADVARGFVSALDPRRGQLRGWLIWAALVFSCLPILRALHVMQVSQTETPTLRPGGIVDQAAQLRLVLGAPWRLLSLDIAEYAEPWRLQNLAGPLGWLDVDVSRAVVGGYRRTLLLGAALEGAFLIAARHGSLREVRQRLVRAISPSLIGIVAGACSVAAIALVLYMGETAVGETLIQGVQARYFLPTWVLAIALLSGSVSLGLGTEWAPRAPSAVVAPPAQARVRTVAAFVLVVLVLWTTLPLIARLFVDLAERYG
ncbi:MAG: DUF2142 domain-containing protein [Myxococcales bacterium]